MILLLWVIIIGLLVVIAILLAIVWAVLQRPTEYPWTSRREKKQ